MSLRYADLDISLNLTCIGAIDADGRVVLKTKLATHLEVVTGQLRELPVAFQRIGLEAVPLSPWLYFELRDVAEEP